MGNIQTADYNILSQIAAENKLTKSQTAQDKIHRDTIYNFIVRTEVEQYIEQLETFRTDTLDDLQVDLKLPKNWQTMEPKMRAGLFRRFQSKNIMIDDWKKNIEIGIKKEFDLDDIWNLNLFFGIDGEKTQTFFDILESEVENNTRWHAKILDLDEPFRKDIVECFKIVNEIFRQIIILGKEYYLGETQTINAKKTVEFSDEELQQIENEL